MILGTLHTHSGEGEELRADLTRTRWRDETFKELDGGTCFSQNFSHSEIYFYISFRTEGKIKILCAPWKVCEERKEERELSPNPSNSPPIDGDWCQPRRNERSAQCYIKKKKKRAHGLLLCTGIQLSRWIGSFYSVIFHNLSFQTCSNGRQAAFLRSDNTDHRWCREYRRHRHKET